MKADPELDSFEPELDFSSGLLVLDTELRVEGIVDGLLDGSLWPVGPFADRETLLPLPEELFSEF